MTEIILSFLISFMIDSPIGVVGTFMIYAFLNVVATVYSVCLKETKGLGPKQLEDLYLPKHKINKVVEKNVELAE